MCLSVCVCVSLFGSEEKKKKKRKKEEEKKNTGAVVGTPSATMGTGVLDFKKESLLDATSSTVVPTCPQRELSEQREASQVVGQRAQRRRRKKKKRKGSVC